MLWKHRRKKRYVLHGKGKGSSTGKKEKLARKELSKTQIFYFRISGVFR